MKVLVVDDVSTNRILLRALLARRGYDVIEADSGVEALERAKNDAPGAIVSDLLMPGMDGFALCRSCKAHGGTAAIPILFYSGTYTSLSDRQFAERLGADGFFVKPREQERLLARIDAIAAGAASPSGESPDGPEFVRESDYLRAHNEALTRKLRDKVGELQAVNQALELDIQRRRRAEIELQEARLRLEHLVRQRTEALATMNQELAEQIEQRQRTEEEAQGLEVQLAHMARLTIAGQMAAELAHELNQPLTAITTYAQTCRFLLETNAPDQRRVLEALDLVAAQAQRAGGIIRRVREFTRKTNPQKRRVDINRLIRDVIALANSEAVSAGAEITLQLADRLPSVQADDVQIQQVVMNLVCNSLDALREAGQPGRRRVNIETAPEGSGRVRVKVCDNGPGLSPEIIDRLFDPFFSTKSLGVGLGLAISRTIVEAHQGRLWYETRDGDGARFQFTLPAVPGDPEPGG